MMLMQPIDAMVILTRRACIFMLPIQCAVLFTLIEYEDEEEDAKLPRRRSLRFICLVGFCLSCQRNDNENGNSKS